MTTSKEMLAYLSRSLVPDEGWPKGLLAIEIEAPRPKVTRIRRGRARTRKTGPRNRADAVWCAANAGTIDVYEIKVSRSDLVKELAAPAKALAWSKYANRFFLFISDPAFLTGLTIPEHWGIVTVPARPAYRKLTVIRDATELVPVAQELAWSRLVAWQAWKSWQTQQALWNCENDYGFDNYVDAPTQEPIDEEEEVAA